MNQEHLNLERHLKKSQIWTNGISAFVALTIALSVGYGFYYNTENTLENHSIQINELKTDINEVKNKSTAAAIFQGVSSTQIKALEEKVNSINAKMDRMDDKLDRILSK